MNRVDHFLELIQAPAPLPTPGGTNELVQPIRDLAEALTARNLGALVQPSDDGRRYHLLLWPIHRPAFRSLALTVWIESTHGIVVTEPLFRFTTADELTEWLERHVQTEEFRAMLRNLWAQSKEPVDARLERANGMATLAIISPSLQERLAQHPAGNELEIEVDLSAGEPIPDVQALRRLNAAGLRFEVRSAQVSGRVVRLRIVKSSDDGGDTRA